MPPQLAGVASRKLGADEVDSWTACELLARECTSNYKLPAWLQVDASVYSLMHSQRCMCRIERSARLCAVVVLPRQLVPCWVELNLVLSDETTESSVLPDPSAVRARVPHKTLTRQSTP